jgi:hypothetical protein
VRDQNQAQRVAEIQRRLGRLWGRASVTLGPRFCEIEEGDWVTWTSDRYFGGDARTFRVEAYSIDQKWQITLTLREIAATAFADDAVFLDDQSDVTPSPNPPDIGSPDSGDWALAAITLDSAGASIPALEITGAEPADENAESIDFAYWQYDGVTDPTVDPDSIAWVSAGNLAPSTTKVDITSVIGGATYYGAVRYFVSGEPGDWLVLGPVTIPDFSTDPLTLEGGSALLTLEGGTTPFYQG